MSETFLALFVAHLMADFPLQPDWMVRTKRNPAVLLLHVIVVTALTVAALGNWCAWLPLAILAGTHLVMDAIKVYLLGDDLRAFAWDQGVHLTVMVALAVAFPLTFSQGFWAQQLDPEQLRSYLGALCLVAGVIATLPVGAILMRKVTAPFAPQLGDAIQGLHNGGTYIGYLERALILLLVLIGQAAGVGFLITAKSILRFGDVKDSGQRKLTEYIIIGTFLSFGWGLLVAMLTQLGLQRWWK
jgi:hypothetical protein